MLTFLITIQKLELLYKNFVFFQLIIMVIEITLDHLKIKLLLTLLYFERVKCCGIIKHVESLIVFFLIYIQVQIIFVWLIYIYSLVLSFFKFVLNTVVYARVIFTHSIWAQYHILLIFRNIWFLIASFNFDSFEKEFGIIFLVILFSICTAMFDENVENISYCVIFDAMQLTNLSKF